MSGLSDAERAAMRHEWSLECRRAGLDHLAESFKKPSVLNPRDDDVLPFTDPSLHRNPIEAVVASVAREDLTSNLDAKLAFLNGEGAAGVAHTGNGKFDAHLVGVASVLRAWGATIPASWTRACFTQSTAPRAFRASACRTSAATTSARS